MRARPLLLALVALPCWSACALALVELGGARLAWAGTIAATVGLAAWAGSRVGTANPVSRTGRWDPLLAAVIVAALLVVPGLAVVGGVIEGSSRGLAWPSLVALGALAGLAALPLAVVAAVAVEVVWPH